MTKALIFDTESTGVSEPRIIEAAWLEVALPLAELSKFEQRYDPQKPIELGALATHHIMDEDLAGMPPYSDFKLPEGTEYLVGYRVDYDWQIIGSPPVKRICVLALCQYLFPELDSHKQSALLYYLDRKNARERLREAHSAAADVLNCMRIFWRVLQTLGKDQDVSTWEKIWEISEVARVPTVFSFGKHKGTPIKDAPRDYKQWLLKQPDVDQYLQKALRA